ncbi:hypothetical protein C8R41DRAFT_863416 [Lentinula lateritia]|uniref:Uncharacterized protein n=1 Tax=Lentinula lateritia TaxID=40482 RepID=A0ABQ8VUM9_9AGAR|nr:hypothetical protein C8R41DRAFT_863416 [Lentinula lateritia]
MANNDSQEYPVDYEDEYFSEVDLGNIEDQPSQEADQSDLDNHTAEWIDPTEVATTDPNSLPSTAIVSTPNSLDSRFRDLGRELRARLNTVSSHRQTSNQSAGNFAAAGGIVTTSSPTRLQVPSRHGHKLGSASKPRKSRNSETAPQPITYPQSSSLDQGSAKETKVQQMHRLESNIVRLETLINCRVEDIQTSTASAASSLRKQMLQDIQQETSRGSDRLASTQASHHLQLKSLIHQELNLLEVQLKSLISSSIPLDAMNDLLATMENLISGTPSSSAPSIAFPPVESSSTLTSPLVQPSATATSLLNRISDSPLPRLVTKRQQEFTENVEHKQKRPRTDPRFAHSATVFLPSDAPPFPPTVNPHIFNMYRQWSSTLSSARGVTLPNVGFIERLGPRHARLCFSPFGLEAFLSTWSAHHAQVVALADISVSRNSTE